MFGRSIINVVSNIKKSQCQAQIFFLISVLVCLFYFIYIILMFTSFTT